MDEERKINWLGLFIKIIIVFIFLLIIIWLVSKIAGSKKLSDTFKKNINNMEEVAVTYFKEVDLPQEKGKSKKITLEEMIENKLIVSVNDNSDNTCDVKKSFAKITREKKNYKLATTLECGKEKNTITRNFSFKDCKNCNNNAKDDSNKNDQKTDTDTNKDNTTNNNNSENNQTETEKTTYYEYVKEWTTYSKWMRGNKTGTNIENKYEYYGVSEEDYYILGTIEKNSNRVEYTVKLNKVPNKDYYFTTIKNVDFLSNNEKEFLSEDRILLNKEISNIPKSLQEYSLQENNFKYTLRPYYYNGEFYINITIKDVKTSVKSYNGNYFVPLKVTLKFASPVVAEAKPSGDYETITYYRYVEKNKEIKWSTESSLEGYTKTGNTKVE